MRTTKELLIIMKANTDLFSSGLCYLASNLVNHSIITEDEKDRIWDYIKTHSLNNRWWPYFWQKGYWKPRLKWLDKQILKLNK
jgi:hypothetical protein